MEKKVFQILLDNEYVEFPLDVFELARRVFKAEIIKYSDLGDEVRKKILSVKELEDSFTVFEHWSDGNITYKIYINDSKAIYRQRFSMGHEIKHIVFKEEDPSEEDEALADYFSKCLIAPKCLIIMDNIESEDDIVEKFELGPQPSSYLFKTIQNRVEKYGRELFDFEKEFLKKRQKIIDAENKKD